MKRLPRTRSFLQSILQKPCIVTYLLVLLLPFIVLLQIIHITLAENGENSISAQPQINALLEYAPTLKVQKFNKRPGRWDT